MSKKKVLGILFLVVFMVLSLAAECETGETITISGYVIGDSEFAGGVSSNITGYPAGGGTLILGTSGVEGKNIVHILIAESNNLIAIVSRVAEVKIEDKKGANLHHGNGINLLCTIDRSETVGGIEAGYEFDDCRLLDPYTDHTFDGVFSRGVLEKYDLLTK